MPSAGECVAICAAPRQHRLSRRCAPTRRRRGRAAETRAGTRCLGARPRVSVSRRRNDECGVRRRATVRRWTDIVGGSTSIAVDFFDDRRVVARCRIPPLRRVPRRVRWATNAAIDRNCSRSPHAKPARSSGDTTLRLGCRSRGAGVLVTSDFDGAARSGADAADPRRTAEVSDTGPRDTFGRSHPPVVRARGRCQPSTERRPAVA